MQESPISTRIDFNADGVQHGHLKLPYSRDDSAWGALMIPITVVRNGPGPTALLTGANHGDEYEGPVALCKLATTLGSEQIRGRVIIVPFMNHSALKAGRRTSPIDNGNLNRMFPGRPDGTPTEKIADYFQRCLLPMADIVVDIHSGGRTLEFIPFAAAHILEDKAQEARCMAAMHAFAAPWSLIMLEIDAIGLYDTAAEALGKTFVTTELGGGGGTSPETIAIAERGVRNVLIHENILQAQAEPANTRLLEMPDDRCYVSAEHDGLLEPCIGLGCEVEAGEVLARVYSTARTGVKPVEYLASTNGVLLARHHPGLIQMGDTLAVIGVPA